MFPPGCAFQGTPERGLHAPSRPGGPASRSPRCFGGQVARRWLGDRQKKARGAYLPLRETATKLTPEQYEKNFADITPPMNARQAAIEASRCLYCFDAPCTIACPTRIDVPGFIKRIMTENVRGAARVILEANILGESCGRVCPTEVLCEGACVMVEKGERAIEIGRLQRYAVDHVLDRKIQLFHAGAPNGRSAACIGSGPASLACAAELARRGYRVTVFDRSELSGGLSTYGIAAYKTRAADSLREVEMVKSLGVEFCHKTEIGRDMSFEQLEKEFNAIFIGVGLGETWAMNIPGEDLDGVCGAIEFIERTKVLPFAQVTIGRRVACIGAGNTAIDVVTAARRLGAVTGLECVRTRLGAPDARGRRTPEPIPESNFTIEVDMIVGAVGQKPVTDFLRPVKGIELRKNGTVAVDAHHQTANPKYFAGGDCVNGGGEVVDAVAEGMTAARGIDSWLGASPGSSSGSSREKD